MHFVKIAILVLLSILVIWLAYHLLSETAYVRTVTPEPQPPTQDIPPIRRHIDIEVIYDDPHFERFVRIIAEEFIMGEHMELLVPTGSPDPIPEPVLDEPHDRKNPEEFFQRLVTHRDDEQNVHDRIMRTDLTNKLLRVIELNGDITDIGIDMSMYIEGKMAQTMYDIRKCASVDQMKKLEVTLNKICNGYTLVMANNSLYREDYILCQVWDRINNEANAVVRNELQQALVTNLVDCAYEIDMTDFAQILLNNGETHTTHCINGRVARVISSLTLLDVDPVLAKPERDEAEIANEAYAKVSYIITTELAAQSEELQTLYGEDKSTLSDEHLSKVELLEETLKNKIRTELQTDYSGIMDPTKLEELIHKSEMCV